MNTIQYIQLTRAHIMIAAVLAASFAWSPPARAAAATEVEPGSLIADAGQTETAAGSTPAAEPAPVHADPADCLLYTSPSPRD